MFPQALIFNLILYLFLNFLVVYSTSLIFHLQVIVNRAFIVSLIILLRLETFFILLWSHFCLLLYKSILASFLFRVSNSETIIRTFENTLSKVVKKMS